MNATPTVPIKRKRTWLTILITAIAVIFLAVVALPLFLNADARRPEIQTELSHATGRKVTLGKIKLRMLPTPMVTIDDVQIGASGDASAENVVVADEIRARVSWSALLRDKFLITAIDVDHAIFTLEKRLDGSNNFTFDAAVKNPQAKSGVAAAETTSAEKLFEVLPSAPIGFLNAETTFSEGALSAPSSPSPSAILAAHNLNFQLANFIAHASDPAEWEIHAKLDGLRVELAALAAPILVASGDATLEHGSLDATFHAKVVATADLQGKLHIADIKRGAASVEVSTPALDAQVLIASLFQRASPAAAASKTSSEPPASANSQAASELIADVRATAERVDWVPYVGGNASAQIRFYSDRTEIWPASITFYGGTLDLTARTDARQHPARFSANFQMRTLDLGRLLANAPAGLRGKISGLADVDLELLGSEGGDWAKALTGSGHFSIRNGKLPGPKLGGTLGHLANAAGLNDIPFKQISSEISIAAGRAAINHGIVDSSLIAATFSGGVNLADQSLDIAGVAKFSPANVNSPQVRALLGAALQNKAAAATLPFALRGTVSEPVFLSGRAATSPPPADTRVPPR